MVSALTPPPNLTVSQWADEYRRLPRETSGKPGRWRTSVVAYMREIMDALNDPFTETVVFRKSVQVAGTELLLNAIGYLAHIAPCPILYLTPKDDDVRKFSIKRLSTMIRDTHVLRTRFVPAKSRDTGNTIAYKKFLGGDITMVGVNSPSNLASLPISVVLSDEDDRQTANSGGEGDPWTLAWNRTTTFANRKGVRVSTPTLAGSSRICAAFDKGDQRYFHVPCPRCDALHVITKDMLKWDKLPDGTSDFTTARLQCPKCGGCYDNAEKNAAVRDPRARWIATKPFTGHRSYFIWAAYSPFHDVKLPRLAQSVCEALASGNPTDVQHLQNDIYAEPYDGVSEKIDDTKLASRAEKYAAAVPRRVLMLSAGLDTQDDRIEAEVVGWGAGEESWSIDYRVFPGDPDIPEGQPGSPWDAVTAFLSTRYRHESGLDMPISTAAIDTGGHKTHAVYDYCNAHRARIHAIKGKGGWDRDPIRGPSRVRFGKKKLRHVFLYTLGVDKLKNQVIGRLTIERNPDDPTAPRPGYCHFPAGRDASYYEQLTAERLVTTLRANRRVSEWKKDSDSARNEALDCRVYAYAAFLIRAPNLSKIALNQKQKLAAFRAASGHPPATSDQTDPSDNTPPAPPAQDAQNASGQDARHADRNRKRRHNTRARVAALRNW